MNDFPAIARMLEKRLAEWENDDDDDESEEGAPAKKGLPEKTKRRLLDASSWADDARLVSAAKALRQELGDGLFEDHNIFRDRVDGALKKLGIRLSGPDLKLLLRTVSWRVENAPPVIAKIHKPGKVQADPLRGLFEHPSASESATGAGAPNHPSPSGRGAGEGAALHPSPSGRGAGGEGTRPVVEYEPDPELRDTEQIAFLEAPPSGLAGGLPTEALAQAGIESFIRREVLPYTRDAWIDPDPKATKIGYEISFTRHFYQPPQLRTLAEISADILQLEQETEGLLGEITRGVAT